jgi:hypothetical protein
VAKMQARFPCCVVKVGFSRDGSAHLASELIAFEDESLHGLFHVSLRFFLTLLSKAFKPWARE